MRRVLIIAETPYLGEIAAVGPNAATTVSQAKQAAAASQSVSNRKYTLPAFMYSHTTSVDNKTKVITYDVEKWPPHTIIIIIVYICTHQIGATNRSTVQSAENRGGIKSPKQLQHDGSISS
eukprot:GHVU01133275.1.p2 GENE.GHVU01133275.1~~GHVU01133275.1.p2  ORF type:complete len:121 (+),score=18.27 GHVU01133275.1:369-731(+)